MLDDLLLVIIWYLDAVDDGVTERTANTTELALHLLHLLDFTNAGGDSFTLKGGEGRQHGKDDGADASLSLRRQGQGSELSRLALVGHAAC